MMLLCILPQVYGIGTSWLGFYRSLYFIFFILSSIANKSVSIEWTCRVCITLFYRALKKLLSCFISFAAMWNWSKITYSLWHSNQQNILLTCGGFYDMYAVQKLRLAALCFKLLIYVFFLSNLHANIYFYSTVVVGLPRWHTQTELQLCAWGCPT